MSPDIILKNTVDIAMRHLLLSTLFNKIFFQKFVFYDQSRPPTHFLLKLKPIELDVPHCALHVLPRDKRGRSKEDT